jgi:hypothetical protein
MVLAPGSVIAWSLATGSYAGHTFAIEVAGIYAFGLYWAFTSWEINKINKQREATLSSISPMDTASVKEVAV